MLSLDEQTDGRTFILKMRDDAGADFFWVEKLRGETAAQWYEIYRNSDWPALRRTAMGVFHNRVGERAADQAQRRNRCVVIHTARVTVEQLSPRTPSSSGATSRPQRNEPVKLLHTWFSQASALRNGSAVYRKPDGSRVNVTRVNSESKLNAGFYRDDEKYLGQVIGADEGGCVLPNRRVRGIVDPADLGAPPRAPSSETGPERQHRQ